MMTFFKRQINNHSISKFRNLLLETDWELVLQCENANSAYDLFTRIFSAQYEKAFPKIEKKIKLKYLNSPWITKGLVKSSKKKAEIIYIVIDFSRTIAK